MGRKGGGDGKKTGWGDNGYLSMDAPGEVISKLLPPLAVLVPLTPAERCTQ
jgi:hypothetical protein